MMSYRLIQSVLFLGILIDNSLENDVLLCYSCKGIECEQLTDSDQRIIICNRKTQLCWAGFIDQQAYRTCASRYCTPDDYSLDQDLQIETCCRTNLCNSASLSPSRQSKSYIPSSHHTTTTTISYFIDQIIIAKSIVVEAEEQPSSKTTLDTSDRLLYDKDFSNRLASISSILLFLMPLLLVLLL